jgi:NAD(P)-dependent dehydrogenase (short-subunit alcohol dehydrogenase family)
VGAPLPSCRMADANGRLSGKVGIVTGAASGIGLATARKLAAEGAAVVLGDIDEVRLGAAVDGIVGDGGQAVGVVADVGKEADWERAVGTARAEFGGLDALHNNAARTSIDFLANDTVAMDIDPEVFMATMETNLMGCALGAKHAIPAMIERGGGSIVSTSSICGRAGDASLIAYGASKGGIDALTRYVASAYGKQGIRCNAVAPGVIMTDNNLEYSGPELIARYERHTLTPRLGTPEDIANLVAFLFSDEAAFITGEVIYIDGGFLSHFPTLAESREAAKS